MWPTTPLPISDVTRRQHLTIIDAGQTGGILALPAPVALIVETVADFAHHPTPRPARQLERLLQAELNTGADLVTLANRVGAIPHDMTFLELAASARPDPDSPWPLVVTSEPLGADDLYTRQLMGLDIVMSAVSAHLAAELKPIVPIDEYIDLLARLDGDPDPFTPLISEHLEPA